MTPAQNVIGPISSVDSDLSSQYESEQDCLNLKPLLKMTKVEFKPK